MDGSRGTYHYPIGQQNMYPHNYGAAPYANYNYYGMQPPLPPGPPPQQHPQSSQSIVTPPPPPPPPNNPLPPGTTSNQINSPSNSPRLLNPRQTAPPPPPPPPPGTKSESSHQTPSQSHSQGGYNKPRDTHQNQDLSQYPPLMPPPLPPVFPWLTPNVQITASTYTNFEKDKSLPFVPVVINNAELTKMTEGIQKQTEVVKEKNLLLYEDIIDEQLPKKLKEMFQPLYCKLCKLTLSSPIVARDHYKGKRHKRAIEVWFEQNPNEQLKAPVVSVNFIPIGGGIVKPTAPAGGSLLNPNRSGVPNGVNAVRGQGANSFDRKPVSANDSTQNKGNNINNFQGNKRPNPSQTQSNRDNSLENPAKRLRKEKKEANSGPNFGYCNVCQVTLTSQANSDQHYQGRPHQTKLLTLRKGGEFGDDPRFGFGKEFANRPKAPPGAGGKPRFNNPNNPNQKFNNP